MRRSAPPLLALTFSLVATVVGCDSEKKPEASKEAPAAPTTEGAAPAGLVAAPGGLPPAHGSAPAGLPAGHPQIAPGQGAPVPALTEDGRAPFGAGGPSSIAWPEAWQRDAVSVGGMRALQARVPKAEGDAQDAEFVIFNPMGGDIDGNIARWEGQFGGPGSVQNRREAETAMGKATLAKFSGAQKVSPEMAAAGAPAPPAGPVTMLTGIITTDAGLVVFKLSGPEATVVANEKAFEDAVTSAK